MRAQGARRSRGSSAPTATSMRSTCGAPASGAAADCCCSRASSHCCAAWPTCSGLFGWPSRAGAAATATPAAPAAAVCACRAMGASRAAQATTAQGRQRAAGAPLQPPCALRRCRQRATPQVWQCRLQSKKGVRGRPGKEGKVQHGETPGIGAAPQAWVLVLLWAPASASASALHWSACMGAGRAGAAGPGKRRKALTVGRPGRCQSRELRSKACAHCLFAGAAAFP